MHPGKKMTATAKLGIGAFDSQRFSATCVIIFIEYLCGHVNRIDACAQTATALNNNNACFYTSSVFRLFTNARRKKSNASR